jgi:hypothetical protein
MNNATRAALRLVVGRAAEWAGEHGFAQPEYAIEVYRAVAVLEPLTRQGDPAHTHWTDHLDDDGRWIVRVDACPYCATMLGEPA